MSASTNYRIRSMTAFARVEREAEQGNFTWEIRSVNHRYLEPGFKLPEQFRALEMPLRDALRKKLARGKIDIHLQFASREAEQSIAINEERLRQLSHALDQISALTSAQSTPSPLQLLNWPGVMQQQELDMDSLQAELLAGFEEALQQLIEVRGG